MAQLLEQQGLRVLERKQKVKERVFDHLPKNMTKMETRIAKLEQRVKRIEENPDPSKPAVNKILYEMEAKGVRQTIQAWKTGNPPFAGAWGIPARAMGFLSWGGIGAADRSSPEEAKRYFNIMESQGFNENACDRTIALMPMVLTGEYPPPSFIVTSNWECVPVYQSYQALAHLLGIPLFSFDRPAVYSERSLVYMTQQIKEIIDHIERMFPGHKYNEDVLIESQELAPVRMRYMREIYQLRKRKPCPISGRETFREATPVSEEDRWKYLEYLRSYRDELYEYADKGNAPVRVWGQEEKLRLCWAVSGPFYYDPFVFLEKLGVSVPCWPIGNLYEALSGRSRMIGDPEFGRKLSPLEEVARGLGGNSWGSLSINYVDTLINTCRDLECDGIVFFKQPGCSPTMPLGALVSETTERELGIPTLELEGRQLDQRGFNERDLQSKLVEFCNLCLSRKKLPPLTRKDLEIAGYY